MYEKVIVDLSWIKSLYNALQNAKTNVWNVEINTYDLGKADTLQMSIQQIDIILQSLNKVVSNPKKYMLNV